VKNGIHPKDCDATAMLIVVFGIFVFTVIGLAFYLWS